MRILLTWIHFTTNIIGVSATMGQAEKISAKEGCQKIGAFMW